MDPGKFTPRRARGGSWGCFYMGNLSIASCNSATWMGRCPSSRWTGGSGLLVHCFTFTHVFGAWYDSSVNSQLLHLIKAYFFSVLVICLPGAGFQFSHAKIIQIRWCLAVLTKYQVTVPSRYSNFSVLTWTYLYDIKVKHEKYYPCACTPACRLQQTAIHRMWNCGSLYLPHC